MSVEVACTPDGNGYRCAVDISAASAGFATPIGYQTNYSGIGGSQGGSIPSGVIPTPIESIEELKVYCRFIHIS